MGHYGMSYKLRYLEQKRNRRLHRLAQKRGLTARLPEVEQTPTWNKRRGKLNAMRFE